MVVWLAMAAAWLCLPVAGRAGSAGALAARDAAAASSVECRLSLFLTAPPCDLPDELARRPGAAELPVPVCCAPRPPVAPVMVDGLLPLPPRATCPRGPPRGA
jgi:hypothetical protein